MSSLPSKMKKKSDIYCLLNHSYKVRSKDKNHLGSCNRLLVADNKIMFTLELLLNLLQFLK